MMTFSLIAAVMVTGALASVIVPLLRRTTPDDHACARSNGAALAVAIYRAELGEVEREFKAGHLSEQHRREAQSELERRLADDAVCADSADSPDGADGLDGADGGAAARGRAAHMARRAGTAAVLLALLPATALALYIELGEPLAIEVQGGSDASAADSHAASQESLEMMVGRLAARLQRQPGNAQDWTMLARSYATLDRAHDAVMAYQRALHLTPRDAQLLADYADAQASANGGDLNGAARQSIEAALTLDPANLKALALAGSGALDRRDYALAIRYWQRLEQAAGVNSEIAARAQKNIDEVRTLIDGASPGGPESATRRGGAVTG
jgi:cytochrome c-type biogenesis protein CcmH